MDCDAVGVLRTQALHSPHLYIICQSDIEDLEGFEKVCEELIPDLVGGRKLALCLVYAIIIHLFCLIHSFSSEVREYKKKSPKREKKKNLDSVFCAQVSPKHLSSHTLLLVQGKQSS